MSVLVNQPYLFRVGKSQYYRLAPVLFSHGHWGESLDQWHDGECMHLTGLWLMPKKCHRLSSCWNTNPMSCRQRSSCSILAGCAVGTRCLIANHLFSPSGSAACCLRDPRYTELKVPSPILRWTSKILSSLGSLCNNSFIWYSKIIKQW